jgi:ABC-type lipoprotein export system ATPase subunit
MVLQSHTADPLTLRAYYADIHFSLKGTRLIFVVGQTGSGKTTLLEEITNQKLTVGNSSKSGMI